MEPNFWLDFGVWGFGMMSAHKEEPDLTIGEIVRRWGHVTATVSLAIFLVTQCQESNKEHAEDVRDKALLFAAIRTLQDADSTQTRERMAAMAELVKRVDIHRTDIDRLQAQLYEHAAQDARAVRRDR